jgi:hypothetical protein
VSSDTYTYNVGGRDSSVGIATGYGLDDQEGRSSNPSRVKKFSLLHCRCRWEVRCVRPPSLSLLTDVTVLEEYDRGLRLKPLGL